MELFFLLYFFHLYIKSYFSCFSVFSYFLVSLWALDGTLLVSVINGHGFPSQKEPLIMMHFPFFFGDGEDDKGW